MSTRFALLASGASASLFLKRVCGVALLAGLAVLAGCARGTAPPETRELRSASGPDAGDPQRRAQVRLELAGLYLGRGQLETALDEVRQALEARPDMAEAHGLRAFILASMGDAAAADQSFLRAIQLAPKDGGALHNRAWFLCQQRRFAESEAQFEAALALPQYRDAPRTLLALGVCQARAGRMEQAERSLTRSYELDPANPVTAFNLSEVLLKRGALERARFLVRRVNDVNEQVSAQSLWLAMRIEKRMGNADALHELGAQLRSRYPQAPETLRYERGSFDD
jgi:type IV pilus assembly protein PilF